MIVSDEGTAGSVTARQYTTAQLPDGWGAGRSDTIGAITNNWNEGNAMEITIDTSAGEPNAPRRTRKTRRVDILAHVRDAAEVLLNIEQDCVVARRLADVVNIATVARSWDLWKRRVMK